MEATGALLALRQLIVRGVRGRLRALATARASARHRKGTAIDAWLEEKDVDIIVQGAWANVNQRGQPQFNLPHTHPSALLSGSYYVTDATG